MFSFTVASEKIKMENVVTMCLIFLQLLAFAYCQRVAPGVPPQQYQQPGQPPNVQYQQVPQQQHYQQVPVQHQVPPQHQQQPPPQQQQYQQQMHVPQHQPHGAPQGHHGQGNPQQLLNTANIAHEKQHIQEHLDIPIDTSKMSEQELQFHYFKMHDADNNNKLDGCELIKSLIHWHEQGHNKETQEKLFKDEELINLIDPILSVDDANNDGYIDYPEFIQAQQKAAAKPGP